MSYIHKFIAFVVLAVFTLIVAVFIGRYQEINQELLINPEFDDGLNQWKEARGLGTITVDDQGTVTIHSSDSSQFVSLSQTITRPNVVKSVKLSADIKVANVVQGGPSRGFNARLSLIGIDGDDHSLPFDTRVISLLGSHSWKRYSRVFDLPVDTEKVVVSAQLLYATGTMWFKNVNLKEVIEKPAYPYLRAISILFWTIFLGWLMYPVIMGCRGAALKGIVLFTITAVLLGTLISGSIFDQYQEDAVTGVKKITNQRLAGDDPGRGQKTKTNEIESKVMQYAQDIGHFMLFGILGISFALVFSLKEKTEWLLIIAMLAGATELLQFFIEGRSPSFLDWIIDMAGALIGLLLFLLVDRSKQAERMVHVNGSTIRDE